MDFAAGVLSTCQRRLLEGRRALEAHNGVGRSLLGAEVVDREVVDREVVEEDHEDGRDEHLSWQDNSHNKDLLD